MKKVKLYTYRRYIVFETKMKYEEKCNLQTLKKKPTNLKLADV